MKASIAIGELRAPGVSSQAARHEWHKIDLAEFPNVKRWFDKTGERPAVKKGMAVP